MWCYGGHELCILINNITSYVILLLRRTPPPFGAPFFIVLTKHMCENPSNT